MTLADALQIRVGDYVTHRAGLAYKKDGTPSMRPIRVTEVYVNASKTIVSLRLASVNPGAWLHATEYELPPHGQRWDNHDHEWITAEEYQRRRLVAKA